MIGGLLQATGCIITSDDGDEFGYFDVSWASPDACPAGAAAEVFTQNRVTGEVLTDIYNCVDGVGTTAALLLGDYDVWVDITTEDGSAVYAQSNSLPASLNFDGDVVIVDLPPFSMTSGYFALTWSIADGGGNALSCDDAFAGGVDIVTTAGSTSELLVDVFDCDAGTGISSEYAIDTYTIVVDLLDSNDAAIDSSVAIEEAITFGNEVVDLGNFDFTVN